MIALGGCAGWLMKGRAGGRKRGWERRGEGPKRPPGVARRFGLSAAHGRPL